MNKETVAPLIKQLIQEIKDAHAEEAVRGFLGEVEQFVLDNSERFVQDQEEKPKMVIISWKLIFFFLKPASCRSRILYKRCCDHKLGHSLSCRCGTFISPSLKSLVNIAMKVNLVVDNSEQKGPPIVVENHPTFKNLFGGIERSTDGAESDHTSTYKRNMRLLKQKKKKPSHCNNKQTLNLDRCSGRMEVTWCSTP